MDFTIDPLDADFRAYFDRHPEAVVELQLVTLIRMYRELLVNYEACQAGRGKEA